MTIYQSPAKINLFLRVLGKRADGFHNIASLFQAVSLFDVLTIEYAEQDQFSGSDPKLLMDEKNLVVRAVRLFRQTTGLVHPLRIHLEKKIPMEAGLGGGSSNAATTLFALNQMLKGGLDEKALAALGATLGSDVPFFFSSGRAFCEGRGEIVNSLALPSIENYFLFKPPFGLSTKEVFQSLQPSDFSSESPEDLLESFQAKRGRYINDLEPAAMRISASLFQYKQSLQQSFSSPVFMTGSGSCLVGVEPSSYSGEIPFFQVASVGRKNCSWY